MYSIFRVRMVPVIAFGTKAIPRKFHQRTQADERYRYLPPEFLATAYCFLVGNCMLNTLHELEYLLLQPKYGVLFSLPPGSAEGASIADGTPDSGYGVVVASSTLEMCVARHR